MRARLSLVLLILISTCAPAVFGQETSGRGRHRLPWPGKDWALDVSLPNFDVTLEEFSTVDRSYSLLAFLDSDDKSKRRHFVLIIRLEPAKVMGSDTKFRDFKASELKKTATIKPTSVKTFEYKQTPGLKYAMGSVPIYSGGYAYPPAPVMYGMDAFFVKDDVWITFNSLTPSLTKDAEEVFYTVLDSVKFTDTSNPSSSFDYYHKGKSLIRQKQFKQAAEHLSVALGLEQKQRQLDDADWRNLLGHLVDIYGATGDNTRLKELLDYGLSHDPTFPLFHLAQAQHYASLGDMDATIASLEKAYHYRKNDKRTALWIDPLTDPTFESFKKNENFRKAVKAMKK